MNESSPASLLVAREELEDCWRGKAEEARERYQVATKRYNKLLEESHGLTPAIDSPLASARRHQSEALVELNRVLRIFSELTVYGRMPEEESTVGTSGEGQ